MIIRKEDLAGNKSLIGQLRQRHPIAIGTIIAGKRVVETCYTSPRGTFDFVPCYRLEGEHELRPVTDNTDAA